jgi:hypothetical protein
VVIGLVVVIVGAAGASWIVSPKVVGPALPALLVAVTVKELTAATLGVPVNRPLEDNEAQAGRLAPVHVIVGVPVAANC